MALSIVDWFSWDLPRKPIGIYGYGEGGMLAMFAGAIDARIKSTVISGFAGINDRVWTQPVDRNFFGLLNEYGPSEILTLVAQRFVITDPSPGPELLLEGNGGAPGKLSGGSKKDYSAMINGMINLKEKRNIEARWIGTNAELPYLKLEWFLSSLLEKSEIPPSNLDSIELSKLDLGTILPEIREVLREARLIKQIDRHNQALLREAHFVRKDFMSKLDLTSVEAYEKSVEQYRDIFRKDVIGEFDQPLLPFNARSRKSWETEKWTGHEVVMDVFPDVFAYGILLLPKDLKPGEKRPVVVCQHGLEGRPTDIIQGDHPAYHDFAAKLCERGFITFSPQNPYIFTDRFRTLQRKAQPLGKSLFSIIVPQHQQIVNWLKTQPNVDGDRIAFYGLSYGGKSAMRIPALVTDYCLSICSADFNEWVLKNASTRENFSYIWTGEYEIFEWDLGSTFNSAEMAALICPRPFMVERGHFDGVGEDHWVGYEYAKVRHLYAAQLKIPDKTEIEWFDGPHTINGQATYKFLHKHLNWPEP